MNALWLGLNVNCRVVNPLSRKNALIVRCHQLFIMEEHSQEEYAADDSIFCLLLLPNYSMTQRHTARALLLCPSFRTHVTDIIIVVITKVDFITAVRQLGRQ